jgi:hypothetical protein
MENSLLNKITLRGFKLGLVSIAVLYFAYLTFKDPNVWAINLVLWPIAALVIFDYGHAKSIDKAYKATKHLKGRSEDADLMLFHLSNENIELAKVKLLLLKYKYPEEIESITIAENAIENYLNKKPWWHFR